MAFKGLLFLVLTASFVSSLTQDSKSFREVIEYGEVVKGELSDGDEKSYGLYSDYYRFYGRAGDDVTIAFHPNSITPAVFVRQASPSGLRLKHNYSKGRFQNSITFKIKKDDAYFIHIRAQDSKQSGEYSFTLTEKNTVAKPTLPDLAGLRIPLTEATRS